MKPDAMSEYREIIERVLRDQARIAPSVGDVELQTVFDRDSHHYLLVHVGWNRHERVYGTIAHVDLVGGKAWIQHDGTEEGLANELHEAGIPSDHIVLGYRMAEVRKHTGYAVV